MAIEEETNLRKEEDAIAIISKFKMISVRYEKVLMAYNV